MLHHRLIASECEGARNKIGYIKWLCKAYEGALRARREETLKARAEKEEQIRTPIGLAVLDVVQSARDLKNQGAARERVLVPIAIVLYIAYFSAVRVSAGVLVALR